MPPIGIHGTTQVIGVNVLVHLHGYIEKLKLLLMLLLPSLSIN